MKLKSKIVSKIVITSLVSLLMSQNVCGNSSNSCEFRFLGVADCFSHDKVRVYSSCGENYVCSSSRHRTYSQEVGRMICYATAQLTDCSQATVIYYLGMTTVTGGECCPERDDEGR